MTEQENESDEQTCPICGQPYGHTVSYGRHSEQADYPKRPEFRDDVSVCESPGYVLTVAYVHHERNETVRKSVVKSEKQPEPLTGFRWGSWLDELKGEGRD